MAQEGRWARYRVKRIREMLYSEGFLKPIYVPDIVRLGYEVMTFVHFRFNPTKEHFEEWGITLPPNLILLGIDKQEGVGLCISATLSESTVQMAHFNRMIKSREIIVGEPSTKLFSLKNSSGKFPFSFSKPIEHRDRWELEADGEWNTFNSS